MGRSGWAKLPFYSLSGERGGLYLRYGRADVSGLPCSASVFATLGFIEAVVTNPLQALPETPDQGALSSVLDPAIRLSPDLPKRTAVCPGTGDCNPGTPINRPTLPTTSGGFTTVN